MTDPICCGEGGTWAPKGGPLAVGCKLCPKSPTYWRTNRADGQSYRERTLDESYASVGEEQPDA